MKTFVLFFLLFSIQVWAKTDTNKPVQDSQLLGVHSLKSENKNLKEIDDNINTPFKKSFITYENILLLQKNNLLRKPFTWSASIPKTEIAFNSNLNDLFFLDLGFEFSYQNGIWSSTISNLVLEYHSSFFLPIDWKWGYFDMFYLEMEELLNYEKTLIEESLFPYQKEALGLGLTAQIYKNFSLIFSLRARDLFRETDNLKLTDTQAMWSLHGLYNTKNQKLFMTLFQDNVFFKDSMKAKGLGGLFKIPFENYLIQWQAEAWNIQKTKSSISLWSFFPYIKFYNRLGVGFLVSSFYETNSNQRTQQFEKITQLNFYLKKKVYLSIKNIQRYSSVFSKNSWDFSLNTYLRFPITTYK